jgi:hypothetical protein
MRGVYEARISIAGLTQAKTLAYLTAPANKVVEILSIEVTNASNETNEQLKCQWNLITSLGTPTGTSITPTKLEQGDQSAGSTVVGDITASEPTYSASVIQGEKGWASLAGYQFSPIPEERPVVAGGASWGLRNMTAPGSGFDAAVVIRFREIG